MSKVTVVSRPNRIVIASKGVQGAPGPVGDATPELLEARDAAVAAASEAASSESAAQGYASTASDAAAAATAKAAEAAASAAEAAGMVPRATRAAISALPIPASGATAYLSEPGREGIFKFVTGNLSAMVSADPYQGLYIAPDSAATGAAGAWRREVTDNTYHGTWFGLTAGLADGRARLQSALDNTATAGTFYMPPFDINVPSNGAESQLWVRKPMRVTGYGRASGIVYTGAVGGLYAQMQIASSDVEVDNIRFYGNNPSVFSGNPSCILIGLHLDPRYTEPTEISRIKVHDCIFEHCSLGVIAFGHFVGQGVGAIVAPRDIEIFRNTITSNMAGISVFGADDVRVHGNTVDIEPDAGMTFFKTPIRVLGSVNVDVFGNDVTGASGTNQNAYGIFIGAAGLKTTEGRRSNRDVRVYDNKGRRVGTAIRIDECRGECVIRDNDFDTLNEAGTDQDIRAIHAEPLGEAGVNPSVPLVVNNLTVTGNTFRGFGYAYRQVGRVDSLVFTHNNFVGSALALNPGGGQFMFHIARGSATKFGNISQNSFLFKSQTSISECLQINSTVAGSLFYVIENWMPELDDEISPGATTPLGIFAPALMVTSRGGAPVAGTAFAPIGSNARFAFGSHAAVSPVGIG